MGGVNSGPRTGKEWSWGEVDMAVKKSAIIKLGAIITLVEREAEDMMEQGKKGEGTGPAV